MLMTCSYEHIGRFFFPLFISGKMFYPFTTHYIPTHGQSIYISIKMIFRKRQTSNDTPFLQRKKISKESRYIRKIKFMHERVKRKEV